MCRHEIPNAEIQIDASVDFSLHNLKFRDLELSNLRVKAELPRLTGTFPHLGIIEDKWSHDERLLPLATKIQAPHGSNGSNTSGPFAFYQETKRPRALPRGRHRYMLGKEVLGIQRTGLKTSVVAHLYATSSQHKLLSATFVVAKQLSDYPRLTFCVELLDVIIAAGIACFIIGSESIRITVVVWFKI
jgi:hypothetical protein